MSYVARRKMLWTLFFIGLTVLAAVSRATTLARLSFDELATKAKAIVRVRCLTASSVWRNGEIWTETEFAVLDRSKGAAPGILRISLPGGKVAHIQSRVDGVPNFREGEEAYLFLWDAPGKEPSVLGWAQGTFRISRDPNNGLTRVTQDSAEMPLFDPATRKFRHGGVRNVPLAVFQLKLKRALERENQ
ncbi:MAG: hypothetical protein JSS69_05465 [Acidobacteria bacterium]|nr:hypothetical protein [Acidobacteriota bacterium]MBS1865349.1 hypothetical protein [Acidobacteriota bacterium]